MAHIQENLVNHADLIQRRAFFMAHLSDAEFTKLRADLTGSALPTYPAGLTTQQRPAFRRWYAANERIASSLQTYVVGSPTYVNMLQAMNDAVRPRSGPGSGLGGASNVIGGKDPGATYIN